MEAPANENLVLHPNMWQRSMETVIERNRYILDNELWTDCKFLIGQEPNQKLFKCHAQYLAKSSELFEDMLYGEGGISKVPYVVPDIKPEAFKVMLYYIYCDELNLQSLELAAAVLQVGKKYGMSHIVKKCQKFLCSASNNSTARAP